MRTTMLAITTAAAITLGVFAPADADAATPIAQASQQRVAVIKIVVEEPDGTVVRAPVKAVRWGEMVSFELTSDSHQHNVQLRPAHASDTVAVDVKYSRDGDGQTSQRGLSVGARRSSVIHNDAKAKVTVTVIPTKVTVDTEQ